MNPGLLPLTRLVLAPHAELLAAAPPAAQQAAAVMLAERRRRDFLAGRGGAALALAALGDAEVAVGRDASGAPLWPPSRVGSIAHDAEWAVAVVARQQDWLALGVDVEPDLPLDADAASVVLTATEQAHVGLADPERRHGRLWFGAKECVHKALHPLRGVWLDFAEVTIELPAPDGRSGRWWPQPLSAAARSAFEGLQFSGVWQRRDGRLLSLLGVRAAS